jgi:mercuric ion binding protein
MKKIISFLTVFLVLTSCNETKKDTSETTSNKNQQEAIADYKNIEVEIEGMTCEIGCARTIESKLSKVKGITYSKVDFEAKKGVFTYDINTLNEEDIVKKIEGIAGGDLYFVTKTKEIEKIIK